MASKPPLSFFQLSLHLSPVSLAFCFWTAAAKRTCLQDKWAKRRREDQNQFTSSHKRKEKNRKKFAEQCTVALLEIRQQSVDCWMSNMTRRSCMWNSTLGYWHGSHQVEGMENKDLTSPKEQETSWEPREIFIWSACSLMTIQANYHLTCTLQYVFNMWWGQCHTMS